MRRIFDLHGELELVDSPLTGANVQTDASRYRMRVTRLAIVGSP